MTTLAATAKQSLDTLMEGNERFRNGLSAHRTYREAELTDIAQIQEPIAAVVSCSDSRVTPEVVFDQPLGKIFCARVPGAVPADSTLWTIDIAVSEFKVPLILVVGHTGCLAVGQVVNEVDHGVGGPLRSMISYAVFKAKTRATDDLMIASIEETVRQTVEELPRRCAAVHRAVISGATSVVGAIYEMETGLVRFCE